jgi:hypothetical protein
MPGLSCVGTHVADRLPLREEECNFLPDVCAGASHCTAAASGDVSYSIAIVASARGRGRRKMIVSGCRGTASPIQLNASGFSRRLRGRSSGREYRDDRLRVPCLSIDNRAVPLMRRVAKPHEIERDVGDARRQDMRECGSNVNTAVGVDVCGGGWGARASPQPATIASSSATEIA